MVGEDGELIDLQTLSDANSLCAESSDRKTKQKTANVKKRQIKSRKGRKLRKRSRSKKSRRTRRKSKNNGISQKN